MRSRIISTGFLVCSLLAVTASGQRPIRQFTLQDDDSGSQFVFDSLGNYAYTNCGKEIKIDGVGTVKISGCTVTFEANARFSLVLAETDLCKRAGRASVLLEGPCPRFGVCEPQHFTVIDSDTTNDTPDCK